MGFEIRGNLRHRVDLGVARMLKYVFGIASLITFLISIATFNIVAIIGISATLGFAGFLFVDWAESIQTLVIHAMR